MRSAARSTATPTATGLDGDAQTSPPRDATSSMPAVQHASTATDQAVGVSIQPAGTAHLRMRPAATDSPSIHRFRTACRVRQGASSWLRPCQRPPLPGCIAPVTGPTQPREWRSTRLQAGGTATTWRESGHGGGGVRGFRLSHHGMPSDGVLVRRSDWDRAGPRGAGGRSRPVMEAAHPAFHHRQASDIGAALHPSDSGMPDFPAYGQMRIVVVLWRAAVHPGYRLAGPRATGRLIRTVRQQ